MKCESCHYFSDATFSGLCTNPGCIKCGEYVGRSDYACNKWEQKRDGGRDAELECVKMCKRCSHKDVCSILNREYMFVSEAFSGKTPVCKHFHEIIPCRECRHYHEETGYCELNSYFVDSDGLCCSPADSPNWEMWQPDETCSRAERRDEADDGKVSVQEG